MKGAKKMRPAQVFSFFVVLLFVTSSLSGPSFAQSSAEWETIRPEGEEFTIQIPKNATHENSTFSYVKRELNTRLYLSTTAGGPIFAVASFSGIKSNPALYTEMARLNSYVDAFRKWFPQKVKGKDAVARLTLTTEKMLNGHHGREYRVTIGDLSGTAQVYATSRRFYAVVSLNTGQDESLQERFLSSFYLPEKVVELPPATVAEKRPEKPAGEAEDTAEAEAEDKEEAEEGKKQKEKEKEQEQGATAAAKTEDSAPASKEPHVTKKGPISGGVLNGKAMYLPRPDYPADARTAQAAGAVVVQITVDEFGNVTSAKAVSGHPLLQQPAVNAALQARFQPTFLLGEPVKVTGVLTFNFVP